MDEAELEKQRRIVMRSSNKRKPFANLTNIVRKPYPNLFLSQSKSPRSSTASDSSIGSTQNSIHENNPLIVSPDQRLPSTPPTLTPAHLVGDKSSNAQRRTTRKTLNMVKADVPFNQTSAQETRNKNKEGSGTLSSSTLENIKGKRKVVDGSLAHNIKNAKNSIDTSIPNSTMKMKDKGKENDVQSSYPHSGNTDINLAQSLLKRKDKGKSIAVPQDHSFMKTRMLEVLSAPSSGVIIKDKGKKIMGSSHVDLFQKDEGNVVVTPIYNRALKKKDKESSCPPLLRTTSNRNQDNEAENILQSKLQTEPPPNKKKKRCSSTDSVEEYTLPQDFVEQQRAYFKEIDDFELEVEEV